jgi:putative ABC transport system substrate-binding protein
MMRILSGDIRGICLSFLVIIPVLLVLSVNTGCERQEETKSYVIGFVNPNPLEKEGAHGFLRNMPKHGYGEGKNVTYIRHETRDKKEIEAAIRDMVDRNVDLIFTMTTPAARMAKEITKGTGIPVVFVLYNALKTGVVKEQYLHECNMTGVQLYGSSPKVLEWLLLIKPETEHVLVPITYDTGAAGHSLEDLKQATEKAGIKLTVSEVGTVEELNESLLSMPEDVDAIFMVHSWLTGSNLSLIIDKLAGRNIPVISAGHVDFEAGVAMSYGPIDNSVGAQAARLADKILKGTPPDLLPVERADYILGINLRTANKLGVVIPDIVLKQADYIVR